MNPYKLTPQAEHDLAEIVDASDWTVRNALKAFDKIHAAVQLLADMPLIGHLHEDVTDKPVRLWSVYKYLIVYRADRKPMEVLRIIHGIRDLPKDFASAINPAILSVELPHKRRRGHRGYRNSSLPHAIVMLLSR